MIKGYTGERIVPLSRLKERGGSVNRRLFSTLSCSRFDDTTKQHLGITPGIGIFSIGTAV